MPTYCTIKDCKRKAYYALTYARPDRCKFHKENRRKQYMICMCGLVQPCFNFLGGRPMYCLNCKHDGMVNVRCPRET